MDYSLLLITEKNPDYETMKEQMKIGKRGVSVKSMGNAASRFTSELNQQNTSLKR